MEPKYIYESHLGGYFTSTEEIDFEYLHCEECGDCDWLVGQASNRAEAKALLWTEEYDTEDYDGSEIQKFIEEEWEE
ncbi:MAG: hypothetical protein LUI12_09965 [Clostridiales bacterium]|nr:hypothetical protein [Clostridiales bacterium]